MIKKKEILKSKFIKLLFFFSFIFLSCKENNNKSIENSLSKRTDSIKNEKESKINNDDKQGFVISCGSGCAISYSEVSRKKHSNKYEIKFNVIMYINEIIEEEYDEIYIFEYNDINVLTKINIKGFDENLLMDNELSIINDLIKISENLIKNDRLLVSANDESKTTSLLYDKKININNVKYEKINTNNIIGLENFSCGDNMARYTELPSMKNVRLILVPQDCADFPYRFYLLSIKDNKVISNLYVEGEWYEPDNYDDIEKTNFNINRNFIITVSKENKNLEKGKIEVLKYKILENGKITQI